MTPSMGMLQGLSVADAAFWIAVAACVIAQAAITRSVLVARQPELPAGSRVAPARRPVELVWALLPAVALAGVLFLTWRAIHPAAGAGAGAPAVERAA